MNHTQIRLKFRKESEAGGNILFSTSLLCSSDGRYTTAAGMRIGIDPQNNNVFLRTDLVDKMDKPIVKGKFTPFILS